MSKITFLCLLVHHGVWNELDHDVFKNIICTCKRIYDYVHTNKPLVQQLFDQLAILVAYYGFFGFHSRRWTLPNSQIWLRNNFFV